MTLRELTMTTGATRTGGLSDAKTALENHDIGVAFRPAPAAKTSATIDLMRLFGLARLPTHRPPLVCHWRRGADGRLFCVWTRDKKPARTP